MAGPLYQGAIELREEEIDWDAIEITTAQLPRLVACIRNTALRMIRREQ